MALRTYSSEAVIAASEFAKERDYWLSKLAGELTKSSFPPDKKESERCFAAVNFSFAGETFTKLLKLSNASDSRLQMILIAVLTAVLKKYTQSTDIVIGTPIYNQQVEGEYLNTVLTLRQQLTPQMSFKELLLQVRENLVQADLHQNFPVELLPKLLKMPESEEDFTLFDTALLVENMQTRAYLKHLKLNMLFLFTRKELSIEGKIEYNAALYEKSTVERIAAHFNQLLVGVLDNLELPLSEIDMLTAEEKQLLLIDFNCLKGEYPQKTIQQIFEDRVVACPENVAVYFADQQITYHQLNEKANQLAHFLQKKGVTTESVVGLMMERSIEMVVSLLAILKSGGAYLPIEPGLPEERVTYMLNNSNAQILITTSSAMQGMSFSAMENFEANHDICIAVTNPRPHIKEFDQLPRPDRSFLDLRKYKNKIGMASVTNCISIQTTRGCPYKCLYCHKIWSKFHVHRSAENIFAEISYYYANGVTNFAFIDDCFNLDVENSSRLFKLIIAQKMQIQLFFPNGLRGDILTPDYIDLMVEAGTRGINLSLETASSRLQKMLMKNLDLEKFKLVIDYIAAKHPNIILEIATMHGFPTETEEEAMLTLNFIKSVKWLHFPYIHILKIFPNTEMEEFALAHGIKKRDIIISKDRAFHELPETLPFPKSFTRKYQANFMNEYFLLKERLLQVLPVQMKILSEEALVQKYNAYLPVEIKTIQDIIDFTQLNGLVSPDGVKVERENRMTIFEQAPIRPEVKPAAKKIMLLDLSQHFSSHSMLYKVTEQPLGLTYLLTYVKERFGEAVDGRVYKSGNDFDSYAELKALIKEYKPDIIGIRTLTFFKEFFHETVALLRAWGVNVPIITGGPYASSDYDTILKDKNVDLVVFGEGEYTFGQLLQEMLQNDFQLPQGEVLRNINGIAFAENFSSKSRQVFILDELTENLAAEDKTNLPPQSNPANLAYVMYTSGSTGKPKGVMVEHQQVNNCIAWMQRKFQLTSIDTVVARTSLTFDPSVWEIFWPLYQGGKIHLLNTFASKDADHLLNLLADNQNLTLMYCPASMFNAMTYLLSKRSVKPQLRLPYLLLGAEPVAMETVKSFYPAFTGEIVNTYGPTECTINNTYYDFSRDDNRKVVPIGKPVTNNQIYIISKDLELLPLGVPGEICIAGASVARGYINNPEKTAENFIQNPFGPGKLYKTGDIGRWLPDGNIEIFGRVDEQVKLRGYRIELGEIEQALVKHENIGSCAVIVRASKDAESQIKTCKSCGITTNYPGVSINEEGVCEICQNLNQYKPIADKYFKTLADLKALIIEQNRQNPGPYDCILLYAGGRGAGYALYQLVEMGLKVLTLTYDNGYFTKTDLENIKKITASVGVENVVLTHKNSDLILKESLKQAHTVCRGCFHCSSSLAAEYAMRHGIKVVVGGTLSRGQIMENKLFMFIKQGLTGVEEIEREIANLQRIAPEIDKAIFDQIDIDVIKDRSAYEQVKFVDFYRFADVTNAELMEYLHHRDDYWQSRRNYAIYSTNCPIKQIGDFGHLQAAGYHYYGSATSWEKRFNHLTEENVKEDLFCAISESAYDSFIQKLGYEKPAKVEKQERYLCAYYTGEHEIPQQELRDYLAKELPEYMLPTYFMYLETLPLTTGGKIDKKALPEPEKSRARITATYVAPKSSLEKKIAEVWQEMLKLDKVGVNDNFFDLGGNSLDIIQVGSKLKELLNQDIPVVTLFTYPTVGALAQNLSKDGQASTEKIDRSEVLDRGRNRLRQKKEMLKGGNQ